MKYFYIIGGILGLTAGIYFFIVSIIDITVEKTAKEIKKILAAQK